MSGRREVAVSALQFLPARTSMAALQRAVQGCRGCPLFRNATQAVFGRGPRRARIMLVGEQPGNAEDLAGEPFVGPAGRVLNEGLAAAGIDRKDAYVTNAVKHFKWKPKGKRRLHQRPTDREIAACLPWLNKEVELMKPQVLVTLGATAAQALLGRDFRVTVHGGRILPTNLADHAVATIHPSSILRQQTSEDRAREMQRFVDHLKVVAGLLNGGG